MTKYIEINIKGQIDRYRLTNISVDDFIDIWFNDILKPTNSWKELDSTTFDQHKNRKCYYLEFNVEDRFEVVHYVAEHRTEEEEQGWHELIDSLI